MPYTCAIVEDEPLAERMMQKYISRVSCLELSWSCSFAEEALEIIEKKK